jgi:hypothetical protein
MRAKKKKLKEKEKKKKNDRTRAFSRIILGLRSSPLPGTPEPSIVVSCPFSFRLFFEAVAPDECR